MNASRPVEPSRELSWAWATLIFFVLAIPLSLWRLGALDLIQMEGIVLDGARYMNETGELIVPHLHGEVYAFKPPLVYWLAAIGTELAGPFEASVRAPIALSGLVMALVIFLIIGQRLSPQAGLLSGLASISGVLALQKMRLAEFDMPLAAAVGVAAALAIAELTAPRATAWRWPLAYLSLGLAFLAKGVPSLMFFGPGLLLAAVLTGSWRRLFSRSHIAGGLLYVLVAGGWLLAAFNSAGSDIFDHPAEDARMKGLAWSFSAFASTLAKPLVLLASFLPWTLAVPLLLRRTTVSESRQHRPVGTSLSLAAGGFVLGGLLIYMAVPATETRYLLPLTGPVGVLCGTLLERQIGRWIRNGARVLAGFIGVLLAIAAPILANKGELRFPRDHDPLLIAAGLLLLFLAIFLNRLPLPAHHQAPGLILAAALGLFIIQTLVITPDRTSTRSQRPIAQAFQQHVPEGTEVWVGRVGGEFSHSSLIYYLDRTIRSFEPGEQPPPSSLAILMSDELPARTGVPFDYEVVAEHYYERRDVLFQLITVAGSDGSAESDGSVESDDPEKEEL